MGNLMALVLNYLRMEINLKEITSMVKSQVKERNNLLQVLNMLVLFLKINSKAKEFIIIMNLVTLFHMKDHFQIIHLMDLVLNYLKMETNTKEIT